VKNSLSFTMTTCHERQQRAQLITFGLGRDMGLFLSFIRDNPDLKLALRDAIEIIQSWLTICAGEYPR
jgi:hypothetical protein